MIRSLMRPVDVELTVQIDAEIPGPQPVASLGAPSAWLPACSRRCNLLPNTCSVSLGVPSSTANVVAVQQISPTSPSALRPRLGVDDDAPLAASTRPQKPARWRWERRAGHDRVPRAQLLSVQVDNGRPGERSMVETKRVASAIP